MSGRRSLRITQRKHLENSAVQTQVRACTFTAVGGKELFHQPCISSSPRSSPGWVPLALPSCAASAHPHGPDAQMLTRSSALLPCSVLGWFHLPLSFRSPSQQHHMYPFFSLSAGNVPGRVPLASQTQHGCRQTCESFLLSEGGRRGGWFPHCDVSGVSFLHPTPSAAGSGPVISEQGGGRKCTGFGHPRELESQLALPLSAPVASHESLKPSASQCPPRTRGRYLHRLTARTE